MIERRRYRRYRFADDSIRVYRHSDKKIGWLIDVCKGGFSYEYIPTHAHVNQEDIIDIFSDKNAGIFLPRVACQKVYDITEFEQPEIASPVQFNRCGLKCDFTKSQVKRLQRLLKVTHNDPAKA